MRVAVVSRSDGVIASTLLNNMLSLRKGCGGGKAERIAYNPPPSSVALRSTVTRRVSKGVACFEHAPSFLRIKRIFARWVAGAQVGGCDPVSFMFIVFDDPPLSGL